MLLRLRNGDGVMEGSPKNLPAEVFFLTYEKKRNFSGIIQNVLNSDEFSSTGNNGFDLISVARMFLQLMNNMNYNESNGDSSDFNDIYQNNDINNYKNSHRNSLFAHSNPTTRPDVYF